MSTTLLSDLLRLSPAERIQLAQDLWDSIAAEPEVLPISESQRQEVARRSEAHRRNPDEALPLEDALERIEQSLS
jgi:putative addiction module component (TIGR02574 family)